MLTKLLSDPRCVLRSLPNKTSCGSDKISYRMMKEAGQGLVGPLVRLFNASLRLRKVPDEWRKTIIKPIFKGGKNDRTDPYSYRPISLTSCVGRTMEKLLNARIFDQDLPEAKVASLSTPIRFPTEPLNRHAALLSGPPMAHGFGRGSQCSISLFRLE